MGGGRGYGPTHSQSLERLFLGIPHLTVIAPSHAHDAGALLQAAIRAGDPVLFVENKLLYPQLLLLGDGEADLRRWEVSDAHGHPVVYLANYPDGAEPDVTVAAYGGLSRLLHSVLARMTAEEVRVLAVLPACISPLDGTIAAAAAAASGRLLVVEESQAAFGWGAEVAAQVMAKAANVQLARLGAQPTVIPAAKGLEDQALVSEAQIELVLLRLLKS
jgi:acetoin:2,6-dichlorophenolindophenol oxidoreductase subunit beta